MKQTIFWISISLITFALGLATAFLWFDHLQQAIAKLEATILVPQKSDISIEQPILAYCELANNSEKYDGKVVRVSAKLWFVKHGYYFLDKNCGGEEKQTAVIFPSGERGLEIENKMAKDMGLTEYNPWNFPETIAVGKFSRVESSGASDSIEDNTRLHFEIVNIEKTSKQWCNVPNKSLIER